MSLVHGFDTNKTLIPLLLAADGSIIAAAQLYNSAGIAIQTDAAGDLIIAGKDAAGTARIIRTDTSGRVALSGLGTDAAVHAVLTDAAGALVISGKDAGGTGYAWRMTNTGDGAVRHGLGSAFFNVKDTIHTAKSNLDLAAGTNTLNGDTTPAGEYWVITDISFRYTGTVAGVAVYFALNNGTINTLNDVQTPVVSGTLYHRTFNVVLRQNQLIDLVITGATLHDDIELWYHGYTMYV